METDSHLTQSTHRVWFMAIAGNFGSKQYISGPSRPKDEKVQSESPRIL